MRGGGGNFGIVTSFLFRAHPVTNVYAGPIFWDIQHAKTIMRFYRDFLPKAPEKLCPFLGLKTVPSTAPFPEEIWGTRICALISCYDGPAAEGEAAMRPVREALPKPLLDGMCEMPFTALQSLFDPLLPKGLQWYWKGDFVKELSDAAIDAHIEHASKSPSALSLMHLYPIDGAVHRVGAQDTAWDCRDATWSMVICGIDSDPAKADALKAWGRRYWEAVHPHNLGGAYVNFMMDDESDGRVEATYGSNYRAARRGEKEVRPAQFLPGQSEHPACRGAERSHRRLIGGSGRTVSSRPSRSIPERALLEFASEPVSFGSYLKTGGNAVLGVVKVRADGGDSHTHAGGRGLDRHAGHTEILLQRCDLGQVGQMHPAGTNIQAFGRDVVQNSIHQMIAAKGGGSVGDI